MSTIDILDKIDASEYREANYRAVYGGTSSRFAEIQREERARREALARDLPVGHPKRLEVLPEVTAIVPATGALGIGVGRLHENGDFDTVIWFPADALDEALEFAAASNGKYFVREGVAR